MSEHEVNHVNCHAWTCPLLGSMRRSTTGGEWLCFVHFGNEPEDWQKCTAELNRLKWLVDVTRQIRAAAMTPHGWLTVEGALNKELVLSQRSDLQRGDHETVNKWLVRLEGVLSNSCREALK